MFLNSFRFKLDWLLLICVLLLVSIGLVTMRPVSTTENTYFFNHQLIWAGLGILVFLIFSALDWRFLKTGGVLFVLFILSVCILAFLALFGAKTRGAASWLHLGFFSVEFSEPVKLLVILVLAKYFSKRHVEIARFKHIFISGFYAGLPAILVFFQPDLGSAVVFFALWLSMILASGVSKRHLFLIVLLVVLIFVVSWVFVLRPYQKERILVFLNPQKDPRGVGYNAMQSVIAIGSGRLWGKGLGFGTQSRLEFLPEHRTDFIFAAFAEEWGFLGVLILFLLFGILIWRVLKMGFAPDQANFERFLAIGLSSFIICHFVIHIAMNTGVLPITGLTLPFLSYGGSNLITLFGGLGILTSLTKWM
jgi:rod shape determining protein RodA